MFSRTLIVMPCSYWLVFHLRGSTDEVSRATHSGVIMLLLTWPMGAICKPTERLYKAVFLEGINLRIKFYVVEIKNGNPRTCRLTRLQIVVRVLQFMEVLSEAMKLRKERWCQIMMCYQITILGTKPITDEITPKRDRHGSASYALTSTWSKFRFWSVNNPECIAYSLFREWNYVILFWSLAPV